MVMMLAALAARVIARLGLSKCCGSERERREYRHDCACRADDPLHADPPSKPESLYSNALRLDINSSQEISGIPVRRLVRCWTSPAGILCFARALAPDDRRFFARLPAVLCR